MAPKVASINIETDFKNLQNTMNSKKLRLLGLFSLNMILMLKIIFSL